MRLIDADAWTDKMKRMIADDDCPGEIKDYCQMFINEINAEPTAYDVADIISDLENRKALLKYAHISKSAKTVAEQALSFAIDTVRDHRKREEK